MDSTVDVPIILSDEFASNMAKAFAEVIVKRSGAVKKDTTGTFGEAVVTLPILGFNSRGEAVRMLQSLLNAHGASLSVDGSYGPATKKAVIAFQIENNLEADGYCGPVTWSAVLT